MLTLILLILIIAALFGRTGAWAFGNIIDLIITLLVIILIVDLIHAVISL